MSDGLQDFISDPRLRNALEMMKRSNDIFDIIKLGENQHSEVLKWLFDPREGHGQGDSILKDFLTAAYAASTDNVHCNRDFFAEWTPSRIARTGFHSMISMREYVLPENGRLDLLLVDPVNKIILIVENKHGARLGQNQLEKYYLDVSLLRARPAFKGYKTAHIVLDRNYGGEQDEDANRKSPRNRWAFLDYQWLKAGAERAVFQRKRGDQSAALVIAYCQNQTDFVAPDEKELDDILADVYVSHRSIIDAMRTVVEIDILEITEGQLAGEQGELWIFAKHYPDLVDRLLSKAGLTFIERRIKSNFPNHDFMTEFGKKYFSLFDKKWRVVLADPDGNWPFYIHASSENFHDELNGFSVSIIYRPVNLRDDLRAEIQRALELEFPELKKGRRNATYRILGKIENLTDANVAANVQSLYLRLEKAAATAVAHTH
jgi:hypothetical protein